MSDTWDQDEAAAFVETLFAKHHSEIHVYLLRMVRDPELAADLTQDAFVKAYRNYDTLEKPENARAWLRRLTARYSSDLTYAPVRLPPGPAPRARSRPTAHPVVA